MKVDEQARRAEKTEVIQLDGEEFPVTDGLRDMAQHGPKHNKVVVSNKT